MYRKIKRRVFEIIEKGIKVIRQVEFLIFSYWC